MSTSLVPTSPAEIEAALAALRAQATPWARRPLRDKIGLLDALRHRADAISQRWVDAAIAAKGLAPDSPLVGEEWASGPWAVIGYCAALSRTLTAVANGKKESLLAGRVTRRPDGQTVVRAFPGDVYDSLLLNGYTAEVWMEPGVGPDELYGTMATFYDEAAPTGAVALVLGAGNIASIAPLDVLYKLYAEGQVCILKMNPVNAYLGPLFEEMFHDFVAAGYLRFAYGGAAVGAALTRHAEIDEIHVTGSGQTYEAIVFGTGPEGAARKTANTPEIDKRVTSELGGISPAIVIPGVWSAADLRFQAEHVVTQKMHNGGFNCIATQVLVLAEAWPQRAAFLAAIEEVFRTLPDRPAYYPGAGERLGHALAECSGAQTFGAGSRALLPLPDATGDHDAFRTEYFAGALAVVSLPGEGAAAFFDAAVAFCNDRLAGTLGASVIVHPDTLRELGEGFERGLAALRYGTVGVNVWSGAGFLLPSACWGAYPGHTRQDIQSGTGVVHNSFLFARPQRTVVRGPFAPFPRTLASGHLHMSPKPLWFVTNTTAATTARRVTHFAADPSPLGLPAIFASALRG